MLRMLALALTCTLAACSGSSDPPDSDPPPSTDTDALPSSTGDTASCTDEIPYDGIDQDCDGADLDDVDGDGFAATIVGGDDCDDEDDAVHPGATDTPYDGVDADCSGGSDNDADGDGVDALAYGGLDCDDAQAAVFPGAVDTPYDGVDSDCDGASDYDADGDGDDSDAHGGGDCDDTDAAVSSLAVDTPYDGVDSDCDLWSDYDADRDGDDSDAHGGTDCDDQSASVYAGAYDIPYDGVDADCAGDNDFDVDGDGDDSDAHGGTDCDDFDPATHPGAYDAPYDGLDRDCGGGSDFDVDGDTYDVDFAGGGDCDDTDPYVHPGMVEIWYDGVDANCDGQSDYDQDGDGFLHSLAPGGDDCDDTDPVLVPVDVDGDTFSTCTGDCDETAPSAHPGGVEVCGDGIDQDCSGADLACAGGIDPLTLVGRTFGLRESTVNYVEPALASVVLVGLPDWFLAQITGADVGAQTLDPIVAGGWDWYGSISPDCGTATPFLPADFSTNPTMKLQGDLPLAVGTGTILVQDFSFTGTFTPDGMQLTNIDIFGLVRSTDVVPGVSCTFAALLVGGTCRNCPSTTGRCLVLEANAPVADALPTVDVAGSCGL